MAVPGYANPFRSAHISPGRIDQGVDYVGHVGDPIYALGPGVVDMVFASGSGWPGGGWVSYRITSGPAKGLRAYVAEDVTPTVHVGQKVTPNTVVGRFNQLGGIETGWAGIGDQTLAWAQNESDKTGTDPGAWSTEDGVTFSNLMAALGAPPGRLTPGGIRGPGGKLVSVPRNQITPGGAVASVGPGASASTGGNCDSSCLVCVPLPSVGAFGFSVGGGGICLFHKSEARALIGGLMLAGGAAAFLVGTALLAAFGLRTTGAAKGVGNAMEATGAAVSLVPGAQAAGAGIAGAGSRVKKAGQEGAARRAQGRAQRVQGRKQAAVRKEEREVAEKKKQLGEPRENKALEVRGGTVRETTAQRAARKRREAASSRATARRAVGTGRKPATREQAGF